MAQFYAEVVGQRRNVSTIGNKKSGIRTITNGWDKGVEVIITHNNGIDEIQVNITGGSNNPSTLINLWNDKFNNH